MGSRILSIRTATEFGLELLCTFLIFIFPFSSILYKEYCQLIITQILCGNMTK